MKKSFGAWLRAQLIDRDMKASDLARDMGINPSVVSLWLNAKRIPTVASCYAIADAMDLPVAYVLRRAGHPTEDDSEDMDNEDAERVAVMFRKLSPDGQKAVVEFVEWQRGREQRAGGGE